MSNTTRTGSVVSSCRLTAAISSLWSGHRLQVERHGLIRLNRKRLPERLDTGLYSGLPLESAINHRTLLHAPVAIRPTKRHMHCQIEYPERFSAFGRAPNYGQPYSRDQAFDQVAGFRSQFDFIKRDKPNAVLASFGFAIVKYGYAV